MAETVITPDFIKKMLSSESGTVFNGYNVGNWYFNKAPYFNQKNPKYFSFGGHNLTEGLWTLERGIASFNIISKIEGCNYKASSNAYWKIVDEKNAFRFWKDKNKPEIRKKIGERFSIPIEHFDEFCNIIAESYNEEYCLEII
tara:strand:- start:475 stop:903 length:429 start_codon:yes stop_codon:yes gene_type:complete